GRGERPFAPTNYDSQPINQPDKNRMEINWNDYNRVLINRSVMKIQILVVSATFNNRYIHCD
nr:hypothetical protein [Xenococcus sp. MO_188.B8]